MGRPSTESGLSAQFFSGNVALEDAQLVVSGGRGLGGPESFEDLEKLAAVMVEDYSKVIPALTEKLAEEK